MINRIIADLASKLSFHRMPQIFANCTKRRNSKMIQNKRIKSKLQLGNRSVYNKYIIVRSAYESNGQHTNGIQYNGTLLATLHVAC